MKKIVKMSLVAAVAVAGLTTANAKPLEEAIKNVDVSGTVVYRYDDRSFDDNIGDSNTNSYKIGLNLKSKVNDDVALATRFLVAGDDAGFVALDYIDAGDDKGDQNAHVTLSNVYFSYTGIANTTVNVGKQGLTTPWTVAIDSDGNEQTGTGILALSTVGPVTLAAAYFNQTNLGISGDAKINGSESLPLTRNNMRAPTVNGGLATAKTDSTIAHIEGDDNVITVGAMANVGPVALDAWYLDMQDSFDTFTVGAAANFDLDAVKLSVGARHTALDFDKKFANGATNLHKEDNSLTKIMLGLKAGIFGANVNYGWTDSEGGLAALDNDATTGMQGYTVQLNGVADAKYLQVSVNAQVLETLNIALNYNTLDKDKIDGSTLRDKDATDTEIYLQATYNMSKNLSTYVRFGEQELERYYLDGAKVKDAEGTIGRLQVQYSF